MSIPKKVELITTLFSQLESEISQFQAKTNLHCVKGCGHCCTKPDIHASPLEFIPWAFDLFLHGKAEEKLTELQSRVAPICAIYQPLTVADAINGKCGDYAHRGLICRLFGYAANRNKHGELQLGTCAIIREGQKENVDSANVAIKQDLPVPIYTDYYMKLAQIDYKMATILVPINKALILAIEEVLQYYAYRPFPVVVKGAA